MKRKRSASSVQGGHTDNRQDKQSCLPPVRDTTLLYACRETLDCAKKNCVPCAYKIGSFDVSLDKEFCKQVPNQRPEQCPRASKVMVGPATRHRPVLGYHDGMSVLAVGDGDFSFSLGVARIVGKGDGQSSQLLLATSYEKRDTLERVYPKFTETLTELKSRHVDVAFLVDATSLSTTLPKFARGRKFHRICWNFPCTAIAKGQDGQNDEMEHNKELVRQFISSCLDYLTPGDGEIHICHKTKPPFNQWQLEEVALEGVTASKFVKAGSSTAGSTSLPGCCDLSFAGKIVFDKFVIPPYTPRKALDRKSFPCHDACIFVFRQEGRHRQHQAEEAKSSVGRFPPTISEPNLDGDVSVLPVTKAMIASIRKSLLRNKTHAAKSTFDKSKKKKTAHN